MKKIIILPFIAAMGSCSFVNTLQTHCKTEVSKTKQGSLIMCALCDSTTEKQILNSLKIKK